MMKKNKREDNNSSFNVLMNTYVSSYQADSQRNGLTEYYRQNTATMENKRFVNPRILKHTILAICSFCLIISMVLVINVSNNLLSSRKMNVNLCAKFDDELWYTVEGSTEKVYFLCQDTTTYAAIESWISNDIHYYHPLGTDYVWNDIDGNRQDVFDSATTTLVSDSMVMVVNLEESDFEVIDSIALKNEEFLLSDAIKKYIEANDCLQPVSNCLPKITLYAVDIKTLTNQEAHACGYEMLCYMGDGTLSYTVDSTQMTRASKLRLTAYKAEDCCVFYPEQKITYNSVDYYYESKSVQDTTTYHICYADDMYIFSISLKTPCEWGIEDVLNLLFL